MSKTYKAIKIDAERNLISTVEITDYKDIQKEIGCETFTSGLRLPENDMLWVDDCGYMTSSRAFLFGENQFAGNGLIVGGNIEGETQDVFIDELTVAQFITFMKPDAVISDKMREEAFDSWKFEAIE